MDTYDERTKSVLKEIEAYYGRIPTTYIAAADAGVLPRLWALGGVTFRTGATEHEDKRICATMVAQTIGLPGLVEAHLMILDRQMGWSREEMSDLLTENYPARMNRRQILLAKLAKTLAVNPTQVDREIIRQLKEEENVSKEALAEIIALHGFVRYMATFVSIYN